MKTHLLALFTALTIMACGDKRKATQSAKEVEAPKKEVVAAPKVQSFTIEANDQMKYNLSEIKAKAGSKVKITLQNKGKWPKMLWDTTS